MILWSTLTVFGYLLGSPGNCCEADANQTTQSSTSVPNLEPNSSRAPCTCVPYYLCNATTSGEGVIDIRSNKQPCKTRTEVCCNDEDRIPKHPTSTSPPPKPSSGCGYRHPQGAGAGLGVGLGFRILGDDNEAQFGEFPWMVAVLREEHVEGRSNKAKVYQCGGSLIHPQVVLTGAHCVSEKHKHFKIRAGEWNTQRNHELYPHQDRDVQSIKIHPLYYAKKLHNSIALLFLESPVNITKNVDVVCLPGQDEVVKKGRCYVTGWGMNEFGNKGKYQNVLKKVDIPIVNRIKCQDELREKGMGRHFWLHRSFICAGGEPGKDACTGDGGSPLVCPISGKGDRFYQSGIVAWGVSCGEEDTPGVYVNVALFRHWIDKQLKLHKLDTTGYQY